MKNWKVLRMIVVSAVTVSSLVLSGGSALGIETAESHTSIKEELQDIPFDAPSNKRIENLSEAVSGVKGKFEKGTSEDKVKLLGEVYEAEPNDSFDLADPVNLGDYVIGSFGWSEDIDIFEIEIDSTQDLGLVGTQESYYNDLGFILVDAYYNAMEPDEAALEDGAKALVYNNVNPGTYYIFATDLLENGGGGLYALAAFSLEEEVPYYDNVLRISGNNRYETAVEISNMGWPAGADTVILARDSTFPDALAGAPLAYQKDAPILLNPKNTLHKAVKAQIKNLGASNVIILGGTSAILSGVEKELREEMGLNVRRIGGKSRYDTAAKIAAELGDYNKAVVAFGGNFPDALSVAPYAAENGLPILLSEKDSLPRETQSALKNVNKTVVVGGTGVITANVFSQLKSKNPQRIAGKDRYDTSIRIAKSLPMSSDMVTIATGENFADALTGSVLAAKYSEPIILVEKNRVPGTVENYLKQQVPPFYTILGGEAAVSNNVLDKLANY
ncbi:cell wall-binding repeat-containing protein [Rossellomorea vietnamensis]|uniref:cell wall-binding repeat-containing protein n=1 Tax=Rossellomorea vietnamensis TaxID=218284 RepID=UPI003CEC6613